MIRLQNVDHHDTRDVRSYLRLHVSDVDVLCRRSLRAVSSFSQTDNTPGRHSSHRVLRSHITVY